MKKIFMLIVAYFVGAVVSAQEPSICISVQGCVGPHDSAVVTLSVSPANLLPKTPILWRTINPSGKYDTLPETGLRVVVKNFPEDYRKIYAAFRDSKGVYHASNTLPVCKCTVLALGDLEINQNKNVLTFAGTTASLYDRVVLMRSYDDRQTDWVAIGTVTGVRSFDISTQKVSSYMRLDGYNQGQFIRSSPIVFVPKIDYKKYLSGFVTSTSGQKLKVFSNKSARNDAELGRQILNGLPPQTYFITIELPNGRVYSFTQVSSGIQ